MAGQRELIVKDDAQCGRGRWRRDIAAGEKGCDGANVAADCCDEGVVDVVRACVDGHGFPPALQ